MRWRKHYHPIGRHAGGRAMAGFRDTHSLEDAVRGVKKINARVRLDRKKAADAAREAHLRELIGLPRLPSRDDGAGE
jgi:hypothetical protein